MNCNIQVYAFIYDNAFIYLFFFFLATIGVGVSIECD